MSAPVWRERTPSDRQRPDDQAPIIFEAVARKRPRRFSPIATPPRAKLMSASSKDDGSGTEFDQVPTVSDVI